MKKSGRPKVLTVNGKAEMVVQDVIEHYDSVFSLELREQESNDIIEYLKSL